MQDLNLYPFVLPLCFRIELDVIVQDPVTFSLYPALSVPVPYSA